jgi:type VI secretion system protein
MSGTHCWLEDRDGTWYVTDTSTNGIYLNGSDQRVDKNDSVALNHGDRIRLGDYELEVDLQGGMAAIEQPSGQERDPFQAHEEDVFASPADSQPAAQADLKDVNTPLSQMDSSLLGDSVSIDELYHLEEDEEEPEEPPSLARRGDQASALDQHFSAPDIVQESSSETPGQYAGDFGEIPDNWDEETGLTKTPVSEPDMPETKASEPPETAEPFSDPEPQPAQSAEPFSIPERQPAPTVEPVKPPPAPVPETPLRPEPPPAPETGRAPGQGIAADSAIAAFAAGAGLDPRQLHIADEADFFNHVGMLFLTMTEGLMQAIASRSQIKSEFRLEQTMIAPTLNNPLKFSVSAQEAMARLLNPSDGAYVSGPKAAAEAIDDINAHQMAVLAGTEAALKSILRRFKPANLESKFGDDSIVSKALPMLKKAKYWEFYKALYDEVSEATDDDFQQFFGSEFSNAYEKQLERLKISREEPSK